MEIRDRVVENFKFYYFCAINIFKGKLIPNPVGIYIFHFAF